MIGNVIYDTIINNFGQEVAPKLCGMIIDLPFEELNEALSSMDNFMAKCKVGAEMLREGNYDPQKEKNGETDVYKERKDWGKLKESEQNLKLLSL